MATVTIWETNRARRRAALVPFCLCLLLAAFACDQEPGPGPNDAGSVSDSGGSADAGSGGADSGGPDSGGAANEGGAGTNPGDGGATKADAGGIPSSGDAGSPGGDGGVGGDGGSAGAKKSPGCGKTSTLKFKPAPEGVGEGGYVDNFQSGGRTRSFILRLPDNYDKEHPYPLIFAFHHVGGTAAGTDSGGDNRYNMAHYGLQKLSNNGAIFVAPQGEGGNWSNPKDLTFVDDMVKLISDNLCVDTTRLFANGFSFGGAMTYSIACARAEVFRGVAIYGAGVITGCEDGNKPIAYWQMHGLTETTFPIDGVRGMKDRFVKSNGCTPQNPPEPPRPEPYLVDGGHICTSYAGCSSGYPLRWCVHQSGHANAVVDGTGNDRNPCANPGSTCSDSCRCTWVPADVWSFFTSL